MDTRFEDGNGEFRHVAKRPVVEENESRPMGVRCVMRTLRAHLSAASQRGVINVTDPGDLSVERDHILSPSKHITEDPGRKLST